MSVGLVFFILFSFFGQDLHEADFRQVFQVGILNPPADIFWLTMYIKFILPISEKNGQLERRKYTRDEYKTIFNGNLEAILKFNRKSIKKTISIVLFAVNHQ